MSTYLLADAGEATRLAVLVYGLGDPVDPGVPADLAVRVTYERGSKYVVQLDIQPCGLGRRG